MFFSVSPESKRDYMVWKLTDSPVKKKVPGVGDSKEDHGERHERTLSLVIFLKKMQQ